MKKITIETCFECPHKDHKGAFGNISYIPFCKKAKKELPYSVSVSRGIAVASPSGVIPDWCPLEDN